MKILTSPVFERAVRKGEIQRPRVLTAVEAAALGHSSGSFWLEQQAVRFPTYPWEWTPGMLEAAGRLQLKLARDLAAESLGFRRAKPYDLEFQGPWPVFSRLRSLEVRSPVSPFFQPFTDFLQGYVWPLLLQRELGLPLRGLFLGQTEGVTLEQAYFAARGLKKFQRPFLTLVTLPFFLSRVFKKQTPPAGYAVSPRQAAYFFQKLLDHLEQALAEVSTASPGKPAASFAYPEGQEAVKRQFVQGHLRRLLPNRVCEVGCADGRFSVEAAKNRAHVLALDNAVAPLESLFLQARLRYLDIVPLHMDILSPTPSLGLAENRTLSFLERTTQSFDLVLALASPGQLTYPERNALQTLLALYRTLSRNHVLLELVGAKDLSFQHRPPQGRMTEPLGTAEFEMLARELFTIEAVQPLRGCDRTLYLLKGR